MPRLPSKRMPRPSTRTVIRVSLPLLSSVLLRGTVLRQPQNVLVHQWTKGRSRQEDQKRVRLRQEMPSMQPSPPPPRDRDATRLRYGRMPLLQRISQSLHPPVLYPEPHQAGAEKEIIEIEKTESGRIGEHAHQGQAVRVLGQRDHARHGGSHTQPRVRCHLQLRRPLPF